MATSKAARAWWCVTGVTVRDAFGLFDRSYPLFSAAKRGLGGVFEVDSTITGDRFRPAYVTLMLSSSKAFVCVGVCSGIRVNRFDWPRANVSSTLLRHSPDRCSIRPA